MKILVVGGAGYIGSHMVKLLNKHRHHVITLDNLSTGHRDAVLAGEFIHGDIANKALLENILSKNTFDAVMHFASYSIVGESMRHPDKYYENNVINTINLLDAMKQHGVNKFIFSSSAAIFGEPQYLPINESHPKQPINPYGRSKFIVEEILKDYDQAFGLKSVCLRYFNAAGADPDGELGEHHQPETHLIPLLLKIAAQQSGHISVFGRDYDTPDGTCIRDYIHVEDLCEAHRLALNSLMDGIESQAYNLGNGNGFSVQEIIDVAKKVTGRSIPMIDAPRRLGDPAKLIANAELVHQKLGWLPQYPDIETIIEHAWQWEINKLPS